MTEEAAGYPSVDDRTSIRSREYYDLIADNAYKDAMIEVLRERINSLAGHIETMTKQPGRIGFNTEESD